MRSQSACAGFTLECVRLFSGEHGDCRAETRLVVAVVAAVAGYFFRSREWLKGQRLVAYSNYLAAFDKAVSLRLNVYSTYVQTGDAIYSDPVRREEVQPLFERTRDAYHGYRMAADNVVLLGNEGIYVTAMNANRFPAEERAGATADMAPGD